MFEEKKRDTLKILGTAAAVAAMPTMLNAKQAVDSFEGVSPDLATIDIQIRVSVTSNDLELVVRNVGQEKTSITQVTPSTLQTGRGHFDIQSLLANGPLSLKPGESFSIPMTRQPTTGLNGVTNSLVADLRDQVSIITDSEAYAAVTVSRMPYFV
jgi:regulator of protease activity HflC (stomatin/prohibitin superfamily)